MAGEAAAVSAGEPSGTGAPSGLVHADATTAAIRTPQLAQAARFRSGALIPLTTRLVPAWFP